MEEQEKTTKLLFGLSQKSTLINIFILLFIANIIWFLKYIQQFPVEVDLRNLPDSFITIDNVPWYYDMPIIILALFMGQDWIEFTFKLEKSDGSWRSFKYRYLYLIGGIILSGIIIKLILLTTYIFIY